MIDRRKMFGAVLAAGGLSAVAADRAVAIAFGDTDYLRERSERLAKHVAEMDRLDAEQREAKAKYNAETAMSDRYRNQVTRAYAFNEPLTVTMPYDDFEVLNRRHVIDYIPDAEGKIMIPVLMGAAVKVTA